MLINQNSRQSSDILRHVWSDRRRILTMRSSRHLRTLITFAVVFLLVRQASANKKNGQRQSHIDLEDEAEVGTDLTLIKSEDVVLVPDEDRNREDEDKTELDEAEDLEDLDGIRILRVEDVIVNKNFSLGSETLENTVKPKSQTVNRFPNDPIILVTLSESQEVMDGRDMVRNSWSSPADRNVALTTSFPTSRKPTRRTPRPRVTVPPRFRYTFFPLPEALPSPPEITKNPVKELPFKVGDNITLECNATGDPQFTWKRGDDTVSTNGSGSLVFKGTTESDGEYQCFAANSGGTAVSTKATVRKAELGTFSTVLEPTVQTPANGSYLVLACHPPKSYPKGVVYWSEATATSKPKPIDTTNRVSLDYDGNLHFANVVMNDSRDGAKYVCTVFNAVLRSTMQGDDQIVNPTPALEGSPKPHAPQLRWSFPSDTKMVTIKDETLRMKCIFSGYPTPTVTWERSDSSARGRMTFPFESYGQEMVIDKVEPEDSGQYRCIATNTASTASVSKTFTVEVESPPYWRNGKPPENAIVAEDGGASFCCIADGYPKPRISWSVDGVPLEDLSPDYRRIVNATHLTFVNLTAADTKVVQCLAENNHGFLLANAYVVVRAEAPMLMEYLPAELKVAEGRNVLLKCLAEGAPQPVITWRKGSEVIFVSTDRFTFHPNGSLEIKNVLVEDSFVYTCSAGNKFGTDSASGHLIVRKRTQIIIPPKTQIAIAQSNVTLECAVVTDSEEMDQLRVNWLKNGIAVNFTAELGRVVLNPEDNSLVIRNSSVLDSATYTCNASNGVDFAEYTAGVTIKDRPGPPLDLHLTTCAGSNTTLSWRPGNDSNDPIVEYVVRYVTSLNESTSITMAAVDSPQTVVELKPWRTYTFSVAARNSHGLSDLSVSPTEACVTQPSTPLRNPANVCSVMRGVRRLVIVWEPLTYDALNGPGFRYVISYKRRDLPDASEEQLAIREWRKNEIVIYDLEEFKPYEIYVQSVNDVGPFPGVVERRLAYTSEGTPIISPQNFRVNNETLNSSSVEFQWEAIDEDSELIKGFFRGYQVQFWKSADKDTMKVVDVILRVEHNPCPLVKARKRRNVKTIMSAVTTGLWPFSRISAGVAVLNSAKTGVLSDPVTFDTPEGVPGPVTNFHVIEIGSFHLRLRWSPPADPNGRLTGYIINYNLASNVNGSTKEMNISDLVDLRAKLYPLSHNSVYDIYICATTAVGRGELVYLQTKTFKSGPPDKPMISSCQVGENYVNISWSPYVDKSVNPGSEFFVEYQKDDQHDEWLKASPADEEDNWANVTDLEAGNHYTFAVVAANLINQTKSDKITVLVGERSAPIVQSASSGWLVAVIIVILLILLIIVILCIICNRNKGGIYPVSKKEKHAGKCVPDKEKEFSEYIRRPDTNHVQSKASLTSEPSEYSDIDDESLGEYEDPETTKFNEDGSFIGKYGTKEYRSV